ncbi:MAG: MlaD family protein [Pseudomonadaceae bacterium]|nr:MlaD family protein [Pseudomonadaceae bacterium]
MTEQPSAIPPARVRPASNWSAIWVLPIIALLIGSWLGWKAYNEQGVMISIHFVSGDGIAAGKTELMYKGMPLGKVQTLELSKDNHSVVAHIEVDREAEGFLRNTTSFWLVKPRVSLAGVTGLETLMSGNYITFEPGEGKKSTEFTALINPPPIPDNTPGLHLLLKSARLESLSEGSPVYYRQIQVGQVNSYSLADDQQSVLIKLHIHPEFEHLVTASTRFWNVSGVSVSASLAGVKVNVESLVSLMAGGIAFDNLGGASGVKDDAAKSVYELYANYDEAQVGIMIELALQDFSGIEPGVTPVRWHGKQVGIVKSAKMASNLEGAIAQISMDPRAEPYLTEGAQFWLVRPSISLAGVKGLEALTQGNFIEIQAGDKNAAAKRNFTALLAPPAPDYRVPGLHLKLSAEQVGSISIGAPVLYRQLKVGSVTSISLARDRQKMQIGLLIEPQFAALINRSSYFWNASGISVNGSLSGIEIKSGSLQSLIEGGIAFETAEKDSKTVGNGYSFGLFSSQADATQITQLIELEVPSAEGLRNGTAVRFKGLDVGRVESLQLNAQRNGVLLKIKLFNAIDLIARKGAKFWIVRPELGLVRTANLDTVIFGPYIEVLPPTVSKPAASHFIARSQAPDVKDQLKGLHLILTTAQRGSLKAGVPVTYRGMPVGQVSYLELSNQAEQVLVHILIIPRYAALVRRGSQFWTASGIDVDFSLLNGAKVRTESVESLLEGGIAFATPDGVSQGPAARTEQRFELHQESKDEWLHWQPRITIGQTKTSSTP